MMQFLISVKMEIIFANKENLENQNDNNQLIKIMTVEQGYLVYFPRKFNFPIHDSFHTRVLF